MHHTNPTYRVGDAEITRIDELTLRGATTATLYPGSDPDVLSRHLNRFGPGSVDREASTLVQMTHAWLVRMPGYVVLIDTATGNGKDRPSVPMLSGLREPFLERLAAAGVGVEDVDHVLLTHLHTDHVGWNTTLRDGTWVPTFGRARHLFSSVENAYDSALSRGAEPAPETLATGLGPMLRRPAVAFYDDSIRPVIEAGLADLIDVDGGEVLEGFSFVPTPGHSIDHASIRLVSRGEEALFAGDVFHHPLQVYEPGLTSCYCEFPQAAHRSRLRVLTEAADRGFPLFTTHFAESSAGRVTRAGDGFGWSFL